MQIYNPDNELVLDIDVSDSSFATDSIMNEDTLSLEFEMTSFLEVPVDSYCIFRNKVYYLLKDSDFTKNGERNYTYKLVMYTDASKSKDVKYGLATVTRNAGQLPKFDYAKKIGFNLKGKPVDFAQLWVDNMNIANGEDAWTIGECIDAPMQTLDFNDQWCFDVLGQLSEAFETEWEIENKTLHIRMVEKMKDSAFPLSYGLGNGLLKGLSRVNYNDGKTINRLIMKGSDRNIVFASYGDTNLHMKKNATIKYDGNYFSDEPEFVDSPNAIEYVTDANGSYVERSDRTGRVKEDSLDLTTIYPMHEGTITSVDPDNDLIFYDANNTINYYDLLIPGNTMQLIPQSGDLIGKEFDVNYNHANKRFTLKRIEGNNDVTYPSGNLIPRVGDKYAVFKIELPQEYIDEAEMTALKKCVRYLYENEVPQYTYTGTLDPIYAQEHWLEIGGYLNCGYFVRFSDDKFLPDGRDIRITQVDYSVNDEMHPKITLSNKVTGKSFTNKQNKIDNQEQTIDRSKDEAIQYAKRRYRDTQETMEMLQESLLNFSEGINPITVQTMQLIAGDPTLQFRFVNSKTDPISPVTYNIIYDPVTKKLHCPSGILQHMTLDIDNITSSRGADEYFFWDMAEYLSPILNDPNKRYYLYAKCQKTANKTDGTGIFLLSETAIAMEAEAGYYYFLVGLLNSEFEDDRSFATMYGYTEVLPGRITTDKIVSSDGNSFLDLVTNVLKLGNKFLFSQSDNKLGITDADIKQEDTNGNIITEIKTDGTASFGNGTHIFNPDGSLNLANGNLLYDLINGLSVTGKIQSNTNGNRIIIDPDDRSFKMLNPDGKEIFILNFTTETSGSIVYIVPKIVLNHWVNGEILYWYELTGYECRFYDKSGNQAYINPTNIGVFNPDGSWGFGISFDGSKLSLSATNLPTSSSGLVPNRIWRNGNQLMIV